MCTLWPWLLTRPWYCFPLTLSCPWLLSDLANLVITSLVYGTSSPCQHCHYVRYLVYFLTLPNLSLRPWCTFWPCQPCHYVPGVPTFWPRQPWHYRYVPGVLSDPANLVITFLVYCLTLPTLSLRPWCTLWPCQPCHYVPGVLSDLVVSLLKSHGQGRESVLCGEGLAGSTRQQEPRNQKNIEN